VLDVAKKYREVRKALTQAGWARARQSGSHETWEHPDGRAVTVAGKDSDTVPRNASRDPSYDRTGRTAMKDYLVIYEQAEDGGWGAHSPDVDGVFALGSTRDEVEERMKEALSAHLAYLRDEGKPVPEPHTDAGRVAA